MKIYVAGSLFTQGERLFNVLLAQDLENMGHKVFLPQWECSKLKTKRDIFKKCLEGLKWCSTVVAVLDGPDVDSGTSWECGKVHEKKPIYGLRTDFRKASDDPETGLNIMLSEGINRLFTGKHQLLEFLGCTRR